MNYFTVYSYIYWPPRNCERKMLVNRMEAGPLWLRYKVRRVIHTKISKFDVAETMEKEVAMRTTDVEDGSPQILSPPKPRLRKPSPPPLALACGLSNLRADMKSPGMNRVTKRNCRSVATKHLTCLLRPGTCTVKMMLVTANKQAAKQPQ